MAAAPAAPSGGAPSAGGIPVTGLPFSDKKQREAADDRVKRVEVGYFTTTSVTTAMRAKFGEDAGFQAKRITARVNKDTNELEVWYDRFFANAAKTKVKIAQLFGTFDEIEKDCPNIIRKFRGNSATAEYDPSGCKAVNEDDYEDSPLVGGAVGDMATFDKFDAGNLDIHHTHDMDKTGIEVLWNSKFNPDAYEG